MFAMYVLVDQGKSWTAALKGSIELTKGNFWKIFWFMFLYGAKNENNNRE